ncbi:glycoside hydrolase family 97 protein [uncultured Sphingomonas sp.]|uniref:glycoside hydrolase family 97 protein n=1 Tax=uncultured Sphingomonas sp. TaxID=158754 RepID=UPI0035CAC048
MLRLRALGVAMLVQLAACLPAPAQVIVRSPDGRAAVTVSIADGRPLWSVAWRGRPVLDPAPIGLRFADRPGDALRIAGVMRRSHDGLVTGLIGKASTARDRYVEAVLTLAGDRAPLELVVRAYDDGVAYRWRFRSAGAFAIADEDAGFGAPASADAWVMPVDGFGSSYEEYYHASPLSQAAPSGALLALPILVRRGGAWAGITEAALHDWAGLYLVRLDSAPGLASRLSPRLDRPGVAVIGGAGPHVSPWRVVMLGDAPGRLVESNLVTLLNPPPDRRDWSWVKPGKTSFPWWNDYVWPGQNFTPGLNTATMDAYIDFDAAHGIPYHTLDGFEGQAWYPGPIGPDGTFQDLTHARSGIDMGEILARARRQGVRLRLWCHWLPLSQQLDAALDQWEKWGVAGLMVDFMNRDDQQMVAFYDEVARKAADHHLTVVYHGAFKPTGENRTWPNVLTREGVRGTEYDKFPDNPGSTPAHEATTPFVRMLAGPMDIHEGGFDAVSPTDFRNRQRAPQVMGTRARALATYVVEENASSMVADTPANYVHAPEFAFVAATPTTWDETRVLAGEVGRYIVVARRRGADWWIGAVNDGEARAVTVPLALLRRSTWKLDAYADTAARNMAAHLTARVGPDTRLRLWLTSAGGYAARLSPLR